jgi:hypothetical protein
MDASGGDDEPEVFDSVHMEGTLQDFCAKVSFAQVLEDMTNVVAMLLGGVREDEDIIKIHNDEEVDHVLEKVVHEVLELCGGIGCTHGHDKPLIGAVLCVERCKPLMTFNNSDIVIAIMKVDFGINCGVTKVVEELIDEGERVAALLCDSIECAIVDTQAEPAILLFHK